MRPLAPSSPPLKLRDTALLPCPSERRESLRTSREVAGGAFSPDWRRWPRPMIAADLGMTADADHAEMVRTAAAVTRESFIVTTIYGYLSSVPTSPGVKSGYEPWGPYLSGEFQDRASCRAGTPPEMAVQKNDRRRRPNGDVSATAYY